MTPSPVKYPIRGNKKVHILTVHSGYMGIIRFERLANVLETGYSYILSRAAGRPVIAGMPVAAGIEISGMCNLSCPECAAGSGQMTRKKGFMKIELFKKITEELRPYLCNINLFFQGEPMLHPGFFGFIEAARGIKTTVSTNGHFLTDENAKMLAQSGLTKLIISLDGMDSETYSLYRKGGDFEKVVNGIRNISGAIRETRSPLKLEIQFLVHSRNETQIPAAMEFSKEVNAVLRLKSMQVINEGKMNFWLPEDEKFRRYTKSNDSYTIKGRLGNHCLRLWLNPVITWDGKVVPCCFDKDADHVMGDMNESSFRTIWKGDKYMAFRKEVLTGRKSIEICRNCTSGLKGVIH